MKVFNGLPLNHGDPRRIVDWLFTMDTELFWIMVGGLCAIAVWVAFICWDAVHRGPHA